MKIRRGALCAAMTILLGVVPAEGRGAALERVAVSPVDQYAPPPILASSAVLLDATTGRWLLLDNADAPRPQASTAKIMTALVAIIHDRPDDTVTAGAAATALGQATGSNMGLTVGERLPLRAMLFGLLLPSGNDAALAIAAQVGGSIPAFVTMMNAEAQTLGLTHTHYLNPHGLDAPGQYSSARDLVLLARRAMAVPLFRQIVATPAITLPATPGRGVHALTNLNWFLRWYAGADGVKPGMTAAAGLCQVLSAHRHGHWLIGALMNTPDLHTDARDLMNYGFGDFRWTPSGQPGDARDAAVPASSAGASSLYFPATGHRVRAGFLDYFARHGGASVLGLPRTDEFVEDGVTVQYFERARLWWDEPAQSAVVSPLGAAAVPAPALLRPVAPQRDTPQRLYVPLTGHTIRGAILHAFQQWGGLDTFGYPLTEEIDSGDAATQYFSTAVFRWTPRTGMTFLPLGDRALQQRGLLAGPVAH